MKWMKQFLSRKWVIVNEEIDYKKINCTSAVEFKKYRKLSV
jgi:hypothetical protein